MNSVNNADDTHIIILAVNVDSRSAELCNITDLSRKNNLKLNLAKSQEIIFVDKRRKANFSAPAITAKTPARLSAENPRRHSDTMTVWANLHK